MAALHVPVAAVLLRGTNLFHRTCWMHLQAAGAQDTLQNCDKKFVVGGLESLEKYFHNLPKTRRATMDSISESTRVVMPVLC